MKRLVIKLALFGAVMVFALAGTLALRTYLWQDKVREHFKIKPGTLALCIGNSHSECSWVEVPGTQIKNSFEHATHFSMFVWRLKEFDRLGQLDNVGTVILQYDWAAFRDSVTSFIGRYRMGFPFMWRYFNEIPSHQDPLNCILGVVTHIGTHWGCAGEPLRPNLRPVDKTFKPRFLKQDRVRGQKPNLDWWFRQVEITAHELDEIKEICQRHGIKLYLVLTPLCEEYRRQDEAIEQFYEELFNLAAEKGIACCDLRAWAPDYLFRDASHLSYTGAFQLSQYFFREYCGWRPVAEEVK